ncbi:hypothetical protein OS493_022561 [Desmophyllum pertusum]|uniref:Uncharacterized protein n=1 Tax=Desmophyllum pertusum TaxID=174260 RepID=A0A9W9ZBA2_9CNID|nr:hypothetical protein OS493_022561 [Desmophyllum pertusum]
MAMITTALTSITLKSEPKLYGSKIAAELNSPEYNVGTRRNAKYDPDKEYHSIEEIVEALVNRDVEGILVDTYSAGLRGDLFNRPTIRVSKVIDYKTAYGVVLSPNSTHLGKCFHRYMLSNRADIFEMIERKAKPIKTSSSSDQSAQEEASGGLLDSSSPTFQKALRYACVCLGIALALSLVYECIRRIRERQKVHQEVHLKTILQKEMQSVVEEFIRRMKETKSELREKHLKQIITYWKLKRKSMTANGNESEWLRISMASPHKGDLMITDMDY